ncbi:nucleus accumbens-associated protein 2 isoform X2 [Poecilia latipinna]|uniref:NACC family member 2 n=2 Tax=Poecilia latipinna TaxID=48699 RepID=A0A3B3VRW7_9TELE|nr:PREDICTED: nucleus accumbens-associated protein 2-like isoform X2 [Poecilia latipinna]XP_014910992.1 PREDICTED: nucleus accumbens-associated protein 2-like isoform X2 [Poecilia latipinna]XP_014910993.1 PREDICTED: nucleus accumbens-associated protein 2-like isoform X2 [Poecilia latipinna]XP_014910994.1 PREDICTED: nucleus accumbens-associated protein 2-like isoform X2 [Poecilia latipinna]XP_014910995.1 PREDICTED: nucleus accumbens-associated protein 2-like isoform X2 [Poecilia latipinna]
MSQLLHVEIPNFGATVLGSLNEQRLLGHHCDVSILVKGQAFKAHRAVLAASSLYFRDLFSSSTKSQFELPSSVTPACFEQILTFCYTGKLTMAASEQLVVMYTAGYLQIQHIVERGMDLMFKASSPHCDSQTAGSLEETGSEPQSPLNNGIGLSVASVLGTQSWSTSALLLPQRKIKIEVGDPTPISTPSTQTKISTSELGSRLARAFYTAAGGPAIPGMPTFHLQGTTGGGAGSGAGGGTGAERSSPGESSLPTTDSPTSYQNDDEEFEEEPYDGITEDAYSQIYGRPTNPYGIQDKAELAAMPLALENRNCVLIRRDLVALPASLISQIGYRCHPKLYTEGDPGEKLELVAGTQVFMTRGQLMNCHLCAGIKHKVLLRRLLATFFDRNTLANSCGTGIRSSTSDPSRKPLDSRVLNAVKLYCQNFNPNFKESEMNVIAADMCTNARRVRKRWLPKIKSMLPDGMEVYRAGMGMSAAAAVGLNLALSAPQSGVSLSFEHDLKSLEQRLYPERKDPLRTHAASPGAGSAGAEAEGEGEAAVQEEQEEDDDEAGSEGADRSLGAPILVSVVGSADTPPEQGAESFGQNLRLNGH